MFEQYIIVNSLRLGLKAWNEKAQYRQKMNNTLHLFNRGDELCLVVTACTMRRSRAVTRVA